jgi:hypothetical protein
VPGTPRARSKPVASSTAATNSRKRSAQ